MEVKKGMVLIRNPARKEEAPREFTFDAVYDWKYVVCLNPKRQCYHITLYNNNCKCKLKSSR